MFFIDPNDHLYYDIQQRKYQLHQMFLEHYKQREIFSWQWWLSIAVLIGALLAWWLLVDKKRLLEICVFGLLANIAAGFLDVMGSDYVLWGYPVKILPQLPLLIPVDYIGVPIVGMLIYQKHAKWGKFILVSTIASAVMSFVLEPIAVWTRLYDKINWRYIYSFPIYIIIYIYAKFLTMWFMKKQSIAINKNAT